MFNELEINERSVKMKNKRTVLNHVNATQSSKTGQNFAYAT